MRMAAVTWPRCESARLVTGGGGRCGEIFLPLKKKYAAVPVYDRYSLKPGTRLTGPVVLEERESTLVVPVKADLRIMPDYTVLLTIKEF